VAEAGDFVSADYEGFAEGAPLRGAKREGVLLEVAPGSLLENKAEGLLGARVGENRELGVSFAQDYAVEELRGKDARVPGQGERAEEAGGARLDDAFVQDLGGEPKTVSDLRAKIRSEWSSRRRTAARATSARPC